jgi:hypothetical protein
VKNRTDRGENIPFFYPAVNGTNKYRLPEGIK